MALAICSEVNRIEPATTTESSRAVPARAFCGGACIREADNGVNTVPNKRHATRSDETLWKT
jgi:hypothetical protein